MLPVVKAHSNWPMHADVFEHPPPRLASWHQIWSDMAPVDRTTQCTEDWSSASVVKHPIVTDPTIWQPGFDLPCHTWSLLNHFLTGQGPMSCKFAQMGSCPITFLWLCPVTDQNHIVDMCPLTKFEGGLKLLHEADWWRSHMAGINSGTHKMKWICWLRIIVKICHLCTSGEMNVISVLWS